MILERQIFFLLETNNDDGFVPMFL